MSELKKCVYLDDRKTPIKAPPGFEDWIVVRSYNEFVEWIKENGIPDYVSFGHDLTEQHMRDFENYQLKGIYAINYSDFTEPTGLHAAQWLCEYVQENNLTLPRYLGVHSENPGGAKNIQDYINGFQKHTGVEQNCFLQKPEFIIENEK